MNAAYRIDGQTASAEAFYALACDPARSVVVEACAGAGKTWMLVSRMLRALLDGVEPQQIVAITFTRKAAGEMRARLDEWLAELAQAPLEQVELALRQRGQGEAEARAAAPRLQQLQAQLLARGRAVEVHTFHAWFAQLLRAAPVALLQRLGLAPELRLIEDESELAQSLGRRFRAAVRRDPALQADYLALARRHGLHRLAEWLQAALDKRVELTLGEAVLDTSLPPPGAWTQDPIADWPRLRDALQTLAPLLGAGKLKAQEAAQSLVEALAQEPAEAGLAAAWAALFTKSGSARKLGAIEGLDAAQTELQELQQARQQWQAHLDHGRLVRLARVQAQALAELKRERGCVDMGDLEHGACALLSDPESAGWLQQQLDLRVRQLLIDEFQDTSPLQWQALQAWLSAYAGAGGGQGFSLFLVGDPKQSIYRFRRAEPRVFRAASEFVVQGLGGRHLACDHTRRNASAVIATVNALFLGLGAAYPGFRAHSSASAETGAVWCLDDPGRAEAQGDAQEPLEGWRPSLERARVEPEEARRAAEARRVATLVQQLLGDEGLPPEQIMVLARRREALGAVAAALRVLGITHEAPESQALIELPEVRDLLALLDVLVSPRHDLALAQVLRSALFDCAESALLALREEAAGRPWLNTLLELPNERAVALGLSRAQALLAAWRSELPGWPAFEALQRILLESEFKARIAARLSPALLGPRWAGVDALLEQALNLDGGRYWSLYGFVRALRQRPLELAARAQGQGVQLLTIHGAKGLEADTVILVDADAAPARAQTCTLLVDWPVERATPARVAFLASESRPPPLLEAALADELDERRREELNGLYVALTRARRRFVLSRTAARRATAAPTPWALLAERLPAWPQAASAVPLGAGPARPAGLRLAAAPVQAAGGEAPPAAAADPRAAALGEALHRVMEWATQVGAQRADLPAWLAAAAQMYALDARAQQDLARWVQGLLSSAELAPWLDDATLLWAGNEVALFWEGQEIRLDRLVCRADAAGRPVWWVLDYKLHPAPAREAEYQVQMQRYLAAVRELQPGETVRGAFISADGRLHPWPSED